MTEETIRSKCLEISAELEYEAIHACFLYSEYREACKEWQKDPNNMAKNDRVGETGAELLLYCRENKQIRHSIQEALKKTEKLLLDDENDPQTKNSEAKKEIAQIKAKIAAIEKKNAQENGKEKTEKGEKRSLGSRKGNGRLPLVVMVISLLAGFVFFTINGESAEPNPVFQFLQGVFFVSFWASAIVVGIKMHDRDRVEKELTELRLKLHDLEKREEWYDNAKRGFALIDKEKYEMILNLISGGSLRS